MVDSANCNRCIYTMLHPTSAGVEQSENHNYKYMGIDALGRVIKINPDFAEQHQLAVIDCLEVCDTRLVCLA
jgi:AP-4 complex subunit epsilon-1